ncbi:MAG TPA: nickel pincer cofactor biosynthesis protein LarB [Candidatus Saccharimonadales bacterium]|nr:nickel pincer cofactor biosynthesis protein LarB [Candidatus Saccharimonadales bacterium]
MSAQPPGYLDLGFAKLDTAREVRTGFAEVIYGEGKTAPEVAKAFAALAERSATVLATRCDAAQADAVAAVVPEARWHPASRTILLRRVPAPVTGCVVIATAGTADAPVAAEAAVSAEAFGANVEWCRDIGIAGIHRLIANVEQLRGANAIIAVAGMDGALPGAIAGLVDVPVIAVPTSVGYGASFEGLAALLTMLNACAPGIAVVNIDNGFGAGYLAGLINRRAAAPAP